MCAAPLAKTHSVRAAGNRGAEQKICPYHHQPRRAAACFAVKHFTGTGLRDMKIDRTFTAAGKDAYAELDFIKTV